MSRLPLLEDTPEARRNAVMSHPPPELNENPD